MKRNFIYILLSAFALSATLTITSCKDDDPSATETNLNRLTAHNWNLTRVTVDGVDKTSLFSGLALQWNKDNSFAVTNGGVMWPSTGTWSFTDGSAQTLFVSFHNSADAEVAIETLNDTQLIISLHWDETTLGQGRVKSVEGDHIFEFEAAD
jgi:hypothetical protein